MQEFEDAVPRDAGEDDDAMTNLQNAIDYTYWGIFAMTSSVSLQFDCPRANKFQFRIRRIPQASAIGYPSPWTSKIRSKE
jgi:hypothetical protein